MKYWVIYTSNGDLAINEISEHGSKNSAIAKYHDVLNLMWADATVQTGEDIGILAVLLVTVNALIGTVAY